MGSSRPLGYSVNGGGWGEGLILPPGSARDSAHWAYANLYEKVRIMIKLEGYYEQPADYQRSMDMIAAARAMGLNIIACIDSHNIATKPGDYHKYQFTPPEAMFRAIEKILRDIGLQREDVLEVDNEAYYVKGRNGLTILQYKDRRVLPYIEGAYRTNFKGQIWAAQTGDKFRDYPTNWDHYWEKNVNWAHGMAEVRHTWILEERPTNPAAFKQAIIDDLENPHRPGKPWYGWEWPIVEDEFSSTGRQVHCNSELAYDMTVAACEAFRQTKVPFGWLTMGGWRPWGQPGSGGWGMSTDLVNDKGEFSMVAKALADDQGKQLPDDPSPPPDTGTKGLKQIKNAQRRLNIAVDKWGTEAGVRKAVQARRKIDLALERYNA